MEIKYSFIIPVKKINDYIRESVPKILTILRDDYEIIIYPDITTNDAWPKTRMIASGAGGPAMKRNLAIRDAVGNILVFMDDDAYPSKDFLERLDQDFFDPNIVAVGGPALTPPDDSFWQKVSGTVFLSRFGGGFPERYVSVGEKRFVMDWPSVNLSVRRDVFALVGGFDSSYWPGEDSKFCGDLYQKIGQKILYDPSLLMYHHRRVGLLLHLKQVGGYGLHRGFFAKRFPATSRHLIYFLPGFFTVFIIIGFILTWFWRDSLFFYITGLVTYLIALGVFVRDAWRYEKNLKIIVGALLYVVATHIVYGIRFWRGLLFTKELKSKFR